MTDLKDFAEKLVNLTVKEVSELTTILKDDYGIEPAAAVAVASGDTGVDKSSEKVEKTEFNIASFQIHLIYFLSCLQILPLKKNCHPHSPSVIQGPH